MSWPPEDPDMWAVEARFKSNKPIELNVEKNKHIAFLNEVAVYFDKQPSNGEDITHWANVSNAENARKTALYIGKLCAQIDNNKEINNNTSDNVDERLFKDYSDSYLREETIRISKLIIDATASFKAIKNEFMHRAIEKGTPDGKV